nr:MAG TPA: Enhancer of rudimentary-like protein [Caudoviricetes sp.]
MMPFCKMMAHTIVLIHRQTGQNTLKIFFAME